MKIKINETSVELLPSENGRKLYYTFYEEGSVVMKQLALPPVELGLNSTVAKQIGVCIDPKDELKPKALQQKIKECLQYLQAEYETNQLAEEKLEEEETLQAQKEYDEKVEKAGGLLANLEEPIIYIGSLIEWLTAGERENILLCFLCYASQVILGNPISVVGLGESSSGKTHVQTVAMSLIPQEYIVQEKKITEAALFRRAQENPYFYDRKIVSYGDMGGKNDEEYSYEAKQLMKELQTEGHLVKPLTVHEGDDFVVKEMILYGNPALTYTTVPNNPLDEQEQTRSITITPRTDNKYLFQRRTEILELGGKTKKRLEQIEKGTEQVPLMVEYLRRRLEEVKIINPYSKHVNELLGESEYYKRDFPKYNNLLKVITAFNCLRRQGQLFENEKRIYVSMQDVQLLFSLLEQYRLSISYTLSPVAIRILEEMSKDGWIDRDFTVNEFYEETKLKLTKNSIRSYFTELNSHGFLKVIGRSGRSNEWNLTDKYNPNSLKLDLYLSDTLKEMIGKELGIETLKLIEKDRMKERLSVKGQHNLVPPPSWKKEE